MEFTISLSLLKIYFTAWDNVTVCHGLPMLKLYISRIQYTVLVCSQGQFCLMLVYLVSLLVYDCKTPKALTVFFVGNVVVFLYLFSDFYRKAYNKKQKQKKV